MAKWMSGMTRLIVSQPSNLTNKQVAEKLGVTTKIVADARRRHNVPHKSIPRNLSERIAQMYRSLTVVEAAKRLDCSENYVRSIWRQMDERIN